MSNTGMLMASSLSSRPTSVDDDFTGNNGDQPNPLIWTLTEAQGTSTALILNNQLRVTIPVSSLDELLRLDLIPRLSGDFELQIDYTDAGSTNPSSTASYPSRFYIQTEDSSTFFMSTFFPDNPSLRKIIIYYNGAFYAPCYESGKFKVKRSGTRYIFWYWTGAQWEWDGNVNGKIFDTSDSSITRLFLRPTADYNAGTITDFDNFILTSGTLVWY